VTTVADLRLVEALLTDAGRETESTP
jgi:hypothetical protein